MPAIYTCPSGVFEPGTTPYQVIVGKRTAFEGLTRPHGIAEFLDGTSNTLLAVEAKNPVIWTKPDDVMFDPPGFDRPGAQADFMKLPTLLGSNHPGGFNALIADGSVRFIKSSINPLTLNALTTRNGGEVIAADAY